MNILFVTVFKNNPNNGGTERITISVANSLKKYYNHNIFSIYDIGDELECNDVFEEEKKLKNEREIVFYLKKWNIDVIIIQGAFQKVKLYKNEIRNWKYCKIIFTHHFEPGFEKYFGKGNVYIKRLKSTEGFLQRIKAFMHLLFYPFERYLYLKNLPRLYKSAYKYSDNVVLLSEKYIASFKDFGKISDNSKFRIIPNMLTYESFFNFNELSKKQNRVLIVSRLTEFQKRISLALDIWKIVKKDNRSIGWCLDIIGDGPDSKMYQEKVKNENIPDVCFWGKQTPINFYRKSSIFMMTSVSEGWGLTLTESMQNGVVPIAFSYPSLYDIINDSKDGFIIQNDNIKNFSNRLLFLIYNDTYRKSMAIEAIKNSKRFIPEQIASSWNSIL